MSIDNLKIKIEDIKKTQNFRYGFNFAEKEVSEPLSQRLYLSMFQSCTIMRSPNRSPLKPCVKDTKFT